ncbi:MAG: efflux RND transporter periplasmic adaptor subunit [Planctomycetes bacterium]|nr:efflux RND transporter periplasmic adaptor subunit [Planctomycetota bacterium]
MKTKLTEQKIAVEQSRGTTAQAKQALQVAHSQAESDVKNAELAVEFAELDVRKYLEGDYPQELRVAQSEITLAEEEQKRAKERLKYSEELQELGYLSAGQVDADRLTVLRFDVKLELTRNSERLLREFSYVRTKRERESKVEEAKRSLTRITNLAEAAVAQAEAKFKAQEATQQLEEAKLAHTEDQIAKCTMRAPRDGVVLYPIPQDETQEDLVIKQGTVIRERQHVFSLPDTDTVQVIAGIHEAMVKQVKPGRKARITIDALPELDLTGEVKLVSPLPDQQSWRKSTAKFYPATVRLDQQADELRPGMNAKVEVQVKELKGVLAVPVQAVMKSGDLGYCYVINGNHKPELRTLRFGRANEQYIEVTKGLAANEQVVLSPDELGFPSEMPQESDAPAESSLANESAGPGGSKQSKRSGASAKADAPKETSGQAGSEAPGGGTKDVLIDYRGKLAGSTAATGKAKFEIKSKDGQGKTEFQVEVQGGPPSANLDVAIDGVVYGQVALDTSGNAKLQWSTKDNSLPANLKAQPGSVVTVGEILSCKLQSKP